MEERIRGKAGQFISEEKTENLVPSDLPDLISSSTKVTGALKDLKEEKENEDVNKPLLKVEVNNPISWFMKWLKDLKKRQTTTVSIRFGIPLIAIPVIILAIGTVALGIYRANFVEMPVISPSPTPSPLPVEPEKTPIFYPTFSKIGKIKISAETKKVFLIVSTSEVIELKMLDEFDFSKIEGKKVLVFGTFYEENVLTILKANDIEVLSTPKPKSTSEASPLP